MRRFIHVLYFYCAAAVSGCSTEPSIANDTKSVVPTGFICSPTPSEAFSPGFVYRVDATGSELLVNDLSAKAPTFAFAAVLPSYDATLARGASLNISLLSGSGGLPSAEASSSGTKTSHVAFGDGQFVLMQDAGIDALTKVILADLTPKAGSRYYVVRDTIRAKRIDIKISGKDETKLGGQATIAKLVGISPSVQFSREETLILSADFPSPLNVCIRAVEIVPQTASDGTTTVTEGGSWRITTRSADPAVVAKMLNL